MKKMEFYVGVWTKSCYGKQTNLMITRPLTTKMPPQLGNHVVSACCINYRQTKRENWAELTFAKTSGTVIKNREKNWPIADQLVPSIDPRCNWPLPSSKNPHFQNEAEYTTFQFLVKICMTMKNHLHIKGWALNLVLMQRPGGSQKSPIVRHISAPVPLSFLKWRIIYNETWINVPLPSYERLPIF